MNLPAKLTIDDFDRWVAALEELFARDYDGSCLDNDDERTSVARGVVFWLAEGGPDAQR